MVDINKNPTKVVELKNITKIFSGITALNNVSFDLRKGEIHALLGENGAGKSTLMKILFGLYEPDAGEIFINGKKANIRNVNDANDLGIGMVHQHFQLIDVFNFLDNIILGSEPVKGGFIKKSEAAKKLKKLSKEYNLDVDLRKKVEDSTVGMQQRAEILKMLYRENDILIFDEPTAVLTPQEIDVLMETFKFLTNKGKSIIFISHKLNEIMQVSDRITVLRRGELINTVNKKDTNQKELAEMMVGRQIVSQYERKQINTKKDPILKVKNLSYENKDLNKLVLNDITFDVYPGEIVCIAGIDGNGQSELAYAITGLLRPKSGEIILNNNNVTNKSIRYLNDHGLSHIPEDRLKYAAIKEDSLADNITLKKYHKKPFNVFGFINRQEVNKYANDVINLYDVRSPLGVNTTFGNMSGGNQQKAVVGRELEKDFDLLVAVQTVRGLDIGAVEYVHKQIIKQRDKGKAVLMVSFDLDEVMKVSDRILVMYEGQIVGSFKTNEVTTEELGLYMSGSKRSINTKEVNKEKIINIRENKYLPINIYSSFFRINKFILNQELHKERYIVNKKEEIINERNSKQK